MEKKIDFTLFDVLLPLAALNLYIGALVSGVDAETPPDIASRQSAISLPPSFPLSLSLSLEKETRAKRHFLALLFRAVARRAKFSRRLREDAIPASVNNAITSVRQVSRLASWFRFAELSTTVIEDLHIILVLHTRPHS